MGILLVCDSRWKALLQHTTVCTAHGLGSTAGHCVSRAADWRAWGKSLEIKMAVVISPVSLCCLLCYAVSPESSSVEMGGDSSSEALDKAPGEEARPAVPLQRPFVPAVLPFLVHKHNVTFLQFDLCLALRWVWDHNAVPFPGQRLGLWPNSCHGREGWPGRWRDGKIQIQGACFPVQRLQPHGSLHFTLDWAWAGSAMTGEGGQLRPHCSLQNSFNGCLGVVCGGHRWWGAWLLLCWCSC